MRAGSVVACIAPAALAMLVGGCMAAYELRPMLEDLECPLGSDFVYESPEARNDHPSRYFYEMEEGAFGRLPRIYLELRLRAEIDQNTDFDDGVFDTDARALSRARITIDSGRYRDWINYKVEIQDSRVAFAPAPEDATDLFDLRQAFVSVSRPRAVWSTKLGRMEFDFGSGRLLGTDWYDNLDRTFDGMRHTLSDRWGRFEPRQWSWRLDGFVGSPVTVADSGFNAAHDDPDLAGIYYGDRRSFPVIVEAGLLLTRTRGTDRETLGTVSCRAFADRMGRAEAFGFEIEQALQFGSSGPDPHSAAMTAASASYTFPTPWRVMVRGCVEYASGDRDPADGRSNAFRPLFPGDMRDRLGLAGFIGQRNMLVWSAGASFGPLEDFRIGADVRWLKLDTGADDWYAADGSPTAVGGREIGYEIDLSGRYSFVTATGREVWIEGGYAILEPGSALVGAGGSVQMLYLQASFRF